MIKYNKNDIRKTYIKDKMRTLKRFKSILVFDSDNNSMLFNNIVVDNFRGIRIQIIRKPIGITE